VVVGNLPYYITSPILEKVLDLGPLVSRAVFLVQEEVARRLAAAPGTPDFGFLTVRTQTFARVALLFPVGRAAFQPPPKVESAVVRLTPRDPAELGIRDAKEFVKFASHCFRQKRKTLRNNLAPAYGRAAVDSWPEASLRAEQLPLEKLAELFERLRSTILRS
jgi:16S rRNA (adenine1518-N6/adenine1519-N6)-dimethyltransferase